MNETVIFAGPSRGAWASRVDASVGVLPPAQQGDVYRAVVAGARTIGLVDGYFEGVPAVWHKEILFALSEGVHVLGAASMGALRAAELSDYGMRGIGRIYNWYIDGTIDADDEVALVHGPAEAGFVALSEPLVNIRATLRKAASESSLSADLCDRILAAAKEIYYKDRTWDRVFSAANLAPPNIGHFTEWLHSNYVDQKRLDAQLLFEAVAELGEGVAPFRSRPAFEPTGMWYLGVAEFAKNALPDGEARILDEARLKPYLFKGLAEKAALAILSRQHGKSPRARELDRLVSQFRTEHGLMTAQRLRDWQQARQMTDVELERFLDSRANASLAIAALGNDLLREIVYEIKVEESYAAFRSRAEQKQRALADFHRKPQMPLHFLVEWYFGKRLGLSAPIDLETIRREWVLDDFGALQELLAREFLFDSLVDGASGLDPCVKGPET